MEKQMPKRLLSGVVVSSNSNKTIVVEVTRRVKHKLYKKIIKRAKKYHAHDENNSFKKGDNVTIQESKPISKLKNWIVIVQETSREGAK
jgi:small subunit ribosomal protein S17